MKFSVIPLLRQIWFSSIRRQITLSFVAVSGVVLLLFGYSIVQLERNFLRKQSVEYAQGLAHTVSVSSTSWVIANDVVGLQEVMKSVAQSRDLRYAMVLTPKGFVLASSDPKNIGLVASDEVSLSLFESGKALATVLIDNDLLLDVAAPVMAGSRLVGWVRIGFGREETNRNLRHVEQLGYLMMAVSVIAALLVALGLSGSLVGRLQRLVTLANQVHAGQRNVRATVDGSDEVCVLANNFNEMLDELEQSETRFRKQSQHLSEVIWATDSGTWEWNVQTGETIFNERWAKIVGYTLEELAPISIDTWSKLVHPDDGKRSGELLTQCFNRESETYMYEARMRHKNGEWVWVMDRGRVVEWTEDGKPLRMSGTHQDITERKQAEQSLRASEEKSRAFFDHSMVGMAVTSLEKGWVNVNDALCASLGYSREELIRLTWAELTYPEDLALDNAQFNRVLKGEIDNYALDKRFVHKDGHLVYTRLAVSCVRKNDGTVDYVVALVDDITERKLAEAELLRFKNVLDNTLDMIFMFEPESLRFVYVNQGAILSIGYSREELLGMTAYQIEPLLPEHKFRQLIAPLLEGEQPSLRFETLHRRKNGSNFSVSVFLQLVTQIDGSSLFVATMHDITEKKESEQVIWQQANFDTLTDLPNRRMFHDRLEQEIKKSHRSGLPMALMLLDLDRFKEVNDSLGHAQGDVLLIEAARRISECVRESDTVARLGGDEFTVILTELEDVNSVERIAQNIIERLSAPFQLLQETVFVSASVGITLYPDDAMSIEALMKNADQAMYLAKNSGRNRFRYFTAALQEAAQNRLRLISDMRSALACNQFRVFYQPIVTLANGVIHKAEALLRWQHPIRGFINPAEFIPLAEETGMIIDIGDWVFREVASQAAHLRESHYAKFQISVNVSPVQFRHKGSDFKAWLDYLQQLGLPGQNIVVEITEGLLLDADTSVTDQLLEFRDAGVRVSLDDFGTGYSSLSYLKKFDIDYLKIDQSFVRNLADDPNDQALCEAIIVMAHKLGLKVIAEGVETEQQRDLLAAYGCDYAQGWLYSKAIPAGEFEALLQRQGRT